MITIVVEGPDKAGKSHAIALIAKHLKSIGCDVSVQSEETHNAGTMAMEESQLMERLRKERIVIQELRTHA
jgi:thymidylate kinase